MSVPERFLADSEDPPHAYTVAELIVFLRELPPGLPVWSVGARGVALVVEERILRFEPIEADEEPSELESP